MARGNAEGIHLPHKIKPSHNSRIEERLAMFEEMFYTLKAGYSKENLHYAQSILHHFLGSIRYISIYRDAKTSTFSSIISPNDISASAIHFMKERIDQHITLQQLADYTGYTPNHFSALFKKAIGHAPLSYFNLLKMQQAAQMLDSTNMKINQIAAKMGYDDTGYFTLLFTKIMGKSPKEYRYTTRG